MDIRSCFAYQPTLEALAPWNLMSLGFSDQEEHSQQPDASVVPAAGGIGVRAEYAFAVIPETECFLSPVRH